MSATAASRPAAGPANQARRRSAARGEVTLFRVAMALILLAVGDDAFGHPEPGTVATDHLAGGLVPLVIGVGLFRGRADVNGDRIGGLGLSVGGEPMLQAAAHTRALRAVVSEGAGVRSFAEHRRTPGVGRVQRWLSNWVVQTGALAVLSNTTPPQDLTKLVARISPRALMLIQAEHGAGGEELNPVYLEAAGEPKILWRANGGHTGALAAQPSDYERRVSGFFDRTLR